MNPEQYATPSRRVLLHLATVESITPADLLAFVGTVGIEFPLQQQQIIAIVKTHGWIRQQAGRYSISERGRDFLAILEAQP